MAARDEDKVDIEIDEEDYEDDDFEEEEEEQQAQEPAPTAAPSLPPRGLPGGLPPRGLVSGGLPARPQPAQPPAPTPPAPAPTPAPSAAPQRPAGLGLGGMGLPSRPSTSASASVPPPAPPAPTPAPAHAPVAPPAAAPKAPAGGLTGLPARQPAVQPQPPAPTPASAPVAASAPQAPVGVPSLPTRPTPTPPPAAPAPSSSSSSQQPAIRPGFFSRPAPSPSAPAPPAAAATASASAASSAVTLASAPASASSNTVIDNGEDRKIQRLQRRVQDLRVNLIRAAGRMGLRQDSEQVNQFLQVISRVETMAGPTVYKNTAARRGDLNKAAEREAREKDSSDTPDSRLNIKIKVLVIGMTGTGKSEFINAMLERPASRTNAFRDSTKGVRVIRGRYKGVQMEFIDTPGLHASNTMHNANKQLLRKIKAAYSWHKPNYVLYVDRLDASRPSLGELTLLSLINETLGAKVWRETMVILSHANACRDSMGPGYDMYSRQKRNIIMQLIRQAAGDAQIRNPMHLVDSHPNCPTNVFGQAVIVDGGANVPWKHNVYMQLIGYRLMEEVQSLFKEAQKGLKKGPAAPAAGAPKTQQDLMRQLMRPRLPKITYFVEQMVEGVLKPPTWAAMGDPNGQETDDEDAEEFQHFYYTNMRQLAEKGNHWAQKEYDMMLKKMKRVRSTYKEAFENEELELMASTGYEGYVAEGLDLGITFDPEDKTNHRYAYLVVESNWQIMPTLDYYGYEHEDAITGFVAKHSTQLFNLDGWGGFPFDIHLAVEKDKASTCLQGESHLSIVHSVPPQGARHISQVTGSFELLKPNLKDVMYQLEVNTFRDGLIGRNDHAGCGMMLARLGENGKLTKGPMGMGLRIQDDFKIGPFSIEACAAKVQTDGPQGGKDEAWGGRAFVHYDGIPGLGMLFDFYQNKTKEGEEQKGGMGSNFKYDWEMLGSACSVKVDYVIGGECMHVDVKMFNSHDYRLAWLLAIPAWNWLKGTIQDLRAGWRGEMVGQTGEEVIEEEEEDGM